VTGRLIVQLAVLRGIDVIATAGALSRSRVSQLGAREVLDRRDPQWPAQVRELASELPAVINAVRGEASIAITAVADGGQLVTITSDPPPQQRGISVSDFYVRPDANQLASLARLLADGKLRLDVADVVRLADVGRALKQVTSGQARGAIVAHP
jgi:NADPH:quinone reductase-like Zn-dependent oxidoreductase